MIETVIITLIYIGLLVGLVWLVLWALGQFGLALPPRVVQIAWVIAILVIILILWRAFGSSLPSL